VINLANQEKRIIVSFDLDFGGYIFKKGYEIETGVILLRFKLENPEKPANMIHCAITQNKIKFDGFFTVLKDEYIRQKPLK
jgi:hypothetical protein